tara:strand:+ start:1804 stop:2016 length:213 start_codon:yes stop_codon:yes gene_type:complete
MFNRVCYLLTQVRHLHDRKLPSVGSITSTTKTKYIAYKSPKAMDYNLNKKPLQKLKPFPKKKLNLINFNK